MDAAAQGMTRILDPYTTYLAPESMDDFERITTGKYGGVESHRVLALACVRVSVLVEGGQNLLPVVYH